MGQPQDPWGQPQDPWGQPQQPWGQPQQPQPPAWEQPPSQGYGPEQGYGPTPQQGYGPPSEPWNAPGSPAPTSAWPQGGYPPPPPPKSNTGAIVAAIGAGVVILLLLGVGGIYLLSRGSGSGPGAGAASATPSDTPTSASPSPTGIDPESLDSRDTDKTRLTTGAIFPDAEFTGDNGETYTRAGTLETSACTGVGTGKAKELMKKHDCGRMVVGVWLNEEQKLFSSLLVIPLDTKSDADALYTDILSNKQKVIDSLTYYCPSDGKPGAELCERKSDNLPTWYASFTTFHRYLFVAISLYTDGHRTEDVSEVDDFTSETVNYVSNVLLGEQE